MASASSPSPVTQAPGARGAAIVTGASRGLGAAIARRLGRDGWPVAVNHFGEPEEAARVAGAIARAGGTAGVFDADVTDEAAVDGLVAAVTDRLGPAEVLVVNATGPQPPVAVEDLTWQTHLDQLVYFVKSPTLLLRAVLPAMRARGRGRVVNIGSDMFHRALPGWSAYTAAKGAQLGLTRAWARELGPAGITVNLVAPGWIPVERHAGTPAELHAAYVAESPLNRPGLPDDIAAAVSFLTSPDAAHITAQELPVNGGHTF
ncbi:SDR family NAD(P)-dependent oxidoreductase [Allonocardiopsis opalescens]|uniref:3-oxoacyl-[acyl-carrier protein] reductase n=1 Tax=Allonocardiopsis opalescens TaxID=1144618 RepID=A0A2T0QB09_9ACTN|nr:SDR family oxidoreductase [Allonocardiopsis opalescens]PRY01005.1 3-oxoacyl-[acyl-carrier protein] reductase [Allonocardiopsis opalescens]